VAGDFLMRSLSDDKLSYNRFISGSSSLPTQQQLVSAAFLCQLFSNLYQPIQVFCYDPKFMTIYMQAGVNDDIALVIDEDGSWEFVL
jgi:hypothetical protein